MKVHTELNSCLAKLYATVQACICIGKIEMHTKCVHTQLKYMLPYKHTIV